MLNRDYLMTYINAMARALGEAIFHKQNNRFSEAMKAIRAGLQQDGQIEQLMDLDTEAFARQLDALDPFEPERWMAISDLLWEKAALHSELEEFEQAEAWLERTLHVLLRVLVDEPSVHRPEARRRIATALELRPEVGLDPRTRDLLAVYRQSHN